MREGSQFGCVFGNGTSFDSTSHSFINTLSQPTSVVSIPKVSKFHMPDLRPHVNSIVDALIYDVLKATVIVAAVGFVAAHLGVHFSF